MTDFATAAAELVGDLADIRASMERLSSRLGNRIDELAARVERLELAVIPNPPARRVLVTAPPWPTTSTLRGAAPTRTGPPDADGRVLTRVTLRPRTEGDTSSDTHDVHTLLAAPVARYSWEVDLALDTAMLDALTWKFGGMCRFDAAAPKAWDRWPGGSTSANTSGTTNTMERLVGSNTRGERIPANARFGVYATFPAVMAEIPAGKDGVQAMVGGARAWVTNAGHTCHWEIDGWQARATWAHHERQVDMPGGTLRHLIDGHEVIALTGLPWPADGMNRVYMSNMIGGSGLEFLPRTDDRTGVLTYTGFALTVPT